MSKQAKESALICDICGQQTARVRRVPRSYGRGKDLLVIQDVPVISCTHCGESYLSAATMHAMERIKRERRVRARKQEVAVVEFA